VKPRGLNAWCSTFSYSSWGHFSWLSGKGMCSRWLLSAPGDVTACWLAPDLCLPLCACLSQKGDRCPKLGRGTIGRCTVLSAAADFLDKVVGVYMLLRGPCLEEGQGKAGNGLGCPIP
jgi:hypothetical protein